MELIVAEGLSDAKVNSSRRPSPVLPALLPRAKVPVRLM